MKRKVIVIILAVVLILGVFSMHPIVRCHTELPGGYMEAIRGQAAGLYAKHLPLVPIYVTVDEYADGEAHYTIYYFPFGAVGMSYIQGDGYSIEKPLWGQ